MSGPQLLLSSRLGERACHAATLVTDGGTGWRQELVLTRDGALAARTERTGTPERLVDAHTGLVPDASEHALFAGPPGTVPARTGGRLPLGDLVVVDRLTTAVPEDPVRLQVALEQAGLSEVPDWLGHLGRGRIGGLDLALLAGDGTTLPLLSAALTTHGWYTLRGHGDVLVVTPAEQDELRDELLRAATVLTAAGVDTGAAA